MCRSIRRSISCSVRLPTTESSARLPRDLDYVFHLACYHGNQSSIHDPLADHQNNTLTTLKLFDASEGLRSLKKVVYAAAGCAVAEKTFDEASATAEDAPVSLFHDSPYSISKLIGEMYGNYYFAAPRAAVREGAVPERLWSGRNPRRRALARNAAHRVAQRHPDLHLEGAAPRGFAGREWRHRDAATSSLSRISRAG